MIEEEADRRQQEGLDPQRHHDRDRPRKGVTAESLKDTMIETGPAHEVDFTFGLRDGKNALMAPLI